MVKFNTMLVLMIALSISRYSPAETLDEIVQRHESTLAGLSCYRVDIRSRPSNQPWDTDYEIHLLAERNGNAQKITRIKPGIITDALGNNPVPGPISSTLSDDSGTRHFSYPQDYAVDIENARKSGKRPTEMEKKSTQKVENRVYEFSNWNVGEQATSLLELKFLLGSVVISPTHFHIWGDDDWPGVSFPIQDEAALHAYEASAVRKYRNGILDSKVIRISGVVAIASALLICGHWLSCRKCNQVTSTAKNPLTSHLGDQHVLS